MMQKSTAGSVIKKLKSRARPECLAEMARFGLVGEKRLGVSIADIRRIAKEAGKNHALALRLWKTGIPEAMHLAALVDDPLLVTDEQMEMWAKDFGSWDVCDGVCANLFDRTPHARRKILEWSRRDEEFVKRAGFVLIACIAVHDKKAPDSDFLRYFPVIRRGARDGRNYVKKGVSWALRSIGKRSPGLHREANGLATELRKNPSKSMRWVGNDTLRDLASATSRRKIRRMSVKKLTKK